MKQTPREIEKLVRKKIQEQEAQFSDAEKREEFTSEEISQAYRGNEVGDARLLVKALDGLFVKDAKRNKFFRFQDGLWKRDLENEALSFAINTLESAYEQEIARHKKICEDPTEEEPVQKKSKRLHDRYERHLRKVNTQGRMERVFKLACTGIKSITITGDEWNADPFLIQAKDRIIDLQTGNDRPSTPKDYINKIAPTPWEGIHAPRPKWESFLFDVFRGDMDVVNYVQKILGAALIGKPIHHEFYIFYGAGRNGKGTILETLLKVLGEDLAGSIKSEMIMESKQTSSGAANPEVLFLQGKRIVWNSETSEGKKLNSEKVKLYSGGDTLTGREVYGPELISFSPTHTLFLLTNDKPRIGAAPAVFARLRMIEFKNKYTDNPDPNNPYEKQINYHLNDELLKEASGILAWLVQGCLLSQSEGLNPPPSVLASGAEYRLDEDAVLQFIQEECLYGTIEDTIQASIFRDTYAKWYEENYGNSAYALTTKSITQRIKAGKYHPITYTKPRQAFYTHIKFRA